MKFILNLLLIGLMGFFCYNGIIALKDTYNDSFSIRQDNCEIIRSPHFCYYVSQKMDYCVDVIIDEDICEKLPDTKKCYKYNSGIKNHCFLHYNIETIRNQIKEESTQICFNIVKSVYFFISAYVCYLLYNDYIWELRSIKIE